MIAGLGTDIVEVERLRESIDRFGSRIEKRLFTDAECAYCRSQANPFPHFAARFAAKEAFLKALGTGLRDGYRWHDAEVVRSPDGAPTLLLSGRSAEEVKARGIVRVLLTLSHTNRIATATVILEAP